MSELDCNYDSPLYVYDDVAIVYDYDCEVPRPVISVSYGRSGIEKRKDLKKEETICFTVRVYLDPEDTIYKTQYPSKNKCEVVIRNCFSTVRDLTPRPVCKRIFVMKKKDPNFKVKKLKEE